MKAILCGILGALLLLMGYSYIPIGKFKPSKDFKQHVQVLSTDSQVYQLVSYQGTAFKKPPFRHWRYVNPAEACQSPRELLAYALAQNIAFEKYGQGGDTLQVEIKPYYEPTHDISYSEYAQFLAYVKDSIVRTVMGGKFKNRGTYGTTHINWDESLKNSDVRLTIADLYYSAIDREPLANPYLIDVRHLTYNDAEVLTQKLDYHPYLQATRPRSVDKKYVYRRRWGAHIYPDTFLWFSPHNLTVDSSLAYAMAKSFWSLERQGGALPMGLDSVRAWSYVNWIYRKWLNPMDEDMYKSIEGQMVTMSTPIYHFEADPEDLSHYAITEAMYQEFVIHCRDSLIKCHLGGEYMIDQYNGTFIVDWDAPLKLKGEDIERLNEFCEVGAGHHLKADVLEYIFAEIELKGIVDTFRYFNDRYHFDHELKRIEAFSIEELMVLPLGEKWQRLLNIDELGVQKNLRTDQRLTGITYGQAKAFWQWRLRVKMKQKKKVLSDYMIPTYQEWRAIQKGGTLEAKSIDMPYHKPSFNYRFYIGL